MKVYVNGYGLAEFKPTQVYRFDGRKDLTQLRGQIRIIRDYLEVRLGAGEEWMDYNYWFDLSQVIFEDNADVNQVIGLAVLTRADLDREEEFQRQTDVDNNEQICGKCGKPAVEDSGFYFTAENLKQAYDTFTDELQAAEAADDTDIEEEIQRVLVGLKSTDIYTNTYQALLSTLRLLIDIREKI